MAGCPSFQTAFNNGYFVQDEKSKMTITSWWQGSNAGIIDFTNEGKDLNNRLPALFLIAPYDKTNLLFQRPLLGGVTNLSSSDKDMESIHSSSVSNHPKLIQILILVRRVMLLTSPCCHYNRCRRDKLVASFT